MNTVGVYLEIRAGYCGGLRVLRSAVCTFRTRKGHRLSSPFITTKMIKFRPAFTVFVNESNVN